MTTESVITSGQIDADSPYDVTLASAMAYNWIAGFEGNSTNKIQAAAIDTAAVAESKIDWANSAGLQNVSWTSPFASTAVTNVSWTGIAGIMVYIPSGATTVTYKADGKIGASAGYARLTSPTATGGTISFSTASQDGWDSEIQTLDVSSDSGWTQLTVNAYVTSGTDYYLRQIALYFT